jgi:hypothetical protein
MTLAQVVYNISPDNEFAKMWDADPEAALAQRGLKLSREEMAFLKNGLQRKNSMQDTLVLSSGGTINQVSWYQSGTINQVSWYQSGTINQVSWYQ